MGGKMKSRLRWFVLWALVLIGLSSSGWAQQSGTIEGSVKDQAGAVVPGAKVEIHNPVSHFDQSTTTDSGGAFRFNNVPFNPYHLTVTASGFGPFTGDVDVRSLVTTTVNAVLNVASSATTVTVSEQGSELVENDPTAHTDVDRKLFSKMPLESASSSISSLVTFTTPGVAADSNGFMHGLGEHQENQFMVDGQAIS